MSALPRTVRYDTIKGLSSPSAFCGLFRDLGFSGGALFDDPIELSSDKIEYWGFDVEGVKAVYPLYAREEFRIFLVQFASQLAKERISQVVRKVEGKGYGSYYVLVFADSQYDNIAITTWLKAGSKLEIEHLIIDRARPVRSDLEALEDVKGSLSPAITYKDYHKAFYEALSKEKLTQRFFDDFSWAVELIEEKVKGVKEDADRRRFALLILTRLMFLYFLQRKGWLGGDRNFIANRLQSCVDTDANFYDDFLTILFFEVMNTDSAHRSKRAREIGGGDGSLTIPYLNGGLFEKAAVEKSYSPSFSGKSRDVNKIFSDIVFEFFEQYRFTLREDLPESREVGIDPELMGKVFEEFIIAEERKQEGAFYTPKEVVEYMSRYSLYAFLRERFGALENDKIVNLVFKNQATDLGKVEAKEILEVLKKLSVVDPAAGSGAFLYGIMIELQRIRTLLGETKSSYDLRRDIISENIYGVDIEPSTIWMAELRLWISLVEEIEGTSLELIPSLPNLEHRLKIGNSLVDRWEGIDLRPPRNERLFPKAEDTMLKELTALKAEFFAAPSNQKPKIQKSIDALEMKLFLQLIESKIRLANEADELRRLHKLKTSLENVNTPPVFLWNLHFAEVFERGGFDIAILNPPYVNTKLVSKLEYREDIQTQFGFVDDLYNHFTHRAFEIVNPGGVVTMITSDTFFTLESKQNMRELLQAHRVVMMMPTMKIFQQMVDTAIFVGINTRTSASYDMLYIRAGGAEKEILSRILPNQRLENKVEFTFGESRFPVHYAAIGESKEVVVYSVPVLVYRNSVNHLFFEPTVELAAIFNRFMKPIVELHRQWWDTISDSKTMKKNQWKIDTYKASLNPGDMTLLGLVTKGGQGIATADNSRFIAILEGTRDAERIKRKIEVFLESITEKPDLERAYRTLKKKRFSTIEILDRLRERYGGDLDLPRGFIYRTIKQSEVFDADSLAVSPQWEKERRKILENGLSSSKPHWILYEKGDKEGNRWFHTSPFYIDWSRDSVEWLRSNSGRKGKGMPVVRNLDSFLQPGVCWSDVNTDILKCRVMPTCINDVKSMRLASDSPQFSDLFILGVMNSKPFHTLKRLISPGNTFQINHARMMPVVVPTKEQRLVVESLVKQAIRIQQRAQASQETSKAEMQQEELAGIERKLNDEVGAIYGL